MVQLHTLILLKLILYIYKSITYRVKTLESTVSSAEQNHFKKILDFIISKHIKSKECIKNDQISFAIKPPQNKRATTPAEPQTRVTTS